MRPESQADRLSMIQAVGETFDTGHTDALWGIFDYAFDEQEVNLQRVENRIPVLMCRTSDVTEHQLVKDSVLTRVSDGTAFRVKRFEPDGTGMTLIQLKS